MSKRKERESEGQGSIGGNNKVKRIHTPYLLATGLIFCLICRTVLQMTKMQNSKSIKRNLKSYRDTGRFQTKHYNKHHNGDP